MMLALAGMASAEEADIDVVWYGYNYSGYYDFSTNVNGVYDIGDYSMNYVGYARTSAVIPNAGITLMNSNPDVVGFTMLFSDDLNPLNENLISYLDTKYNVSSPSAITISVFAEDYPDGISAAPDYFTIRDTYDNNNTVTSDVADAWFGAMDENEIDAWASTWSDFLILMEAIAPHV
ncbi:hypothetical protein [Methanolapillus millepedarum]